MDSLGLIVRVPFFLLFSFNKETQDKKGKRVLLVYLDLNGFALGKALGFGGLGFGGSGFGV